jgi:hypothetical protein
LPFPRLRTRFSSDIKDGILVRWTGNTDSEYDAFGSTWKSFRRYESISDAVGTPKTQRVKPVDHVRAHYTGLPYQTFLCDHGYQIVITDESSLPRIDIEELLGEDLFSIPHSERVIAAQEAFNAFSDRFPTKISGAEFGQGLAELTALLPKLSASVTQTIAGTFLTKKFGWDNLISDIRQFTTLVDSIRERMEFLKRTYGKPTKLHFRKPDLQVADTSWIREFEPARGWGVRLILRDYQCDFTAGATLVQEMGHIDDFIGWLRAIVISLGLNNLADSAWKTSRLSFVVDWFFNVSGSLHRLAAVQPADKWDVFDVYSSVKLKAVFEVWQYNHDIWDGPESPDQFLGHMELSRYQRWVGLPLDLSLFTPSSLSPDQLVLLLAMAGSKS